MELISKEGIQGYFLDDIKKELTKKQYKDFSEWLRGQTVAIVDDKSLVYKWDYDRWKSGLARVW